MFNPIEMRRRMVQERIEKSFDNEIEKAKHQVGEVHPNGKWIWTEYAPGKFDWKSKKGKYYKNGGSNTAVPSKTPEDNEYAERFKKNFKDASDDVLNKVISGKIRGTDADKRLAKEILDERKSSAEGEKYAAKIIDLLKVSSSKYSDIKKVTAFKTDKGNWAIDYDGANTGIILNGSKLSEKGLKAAGVKIEGANAEKKGVKSDVKIDETTIDQSEYDSQLKMAKQVDDKSRSMAKNIIQGNIDKTKKKLQETISSRPGAKATIANLQKDLTKFISQKKAVEDAGATDDAKSKTDPRDKTAQDAGFKNYDEMSGYQEYVTAKNLLKKPSMKMKSKEADRKELEKQVADYEKDHADVIKRIEAKNGKKKADKKSDDWNDNLSGYKTPPFEGAVKVADLKVGDKLVGHKGRTMTVIGVNKTKDGTDVGVKFDNPRIGDGTHWSVFNNNSYYGAKKAEEKKDDIKSLTSSVQDAYSKVYNWIKEDEENGNPNSNGGKKILDYLQNIEGNLKILSQGKASDDDLKKLQDDVKSLSSAWNAVGYGESNLPISKEDVTKLIASNKKKAVDSYASMDIKDAKKALVGKVVTLVDYWPDGRGGSQDAIGEIKNVRLYGKNKTPIAEVVYPNGDEQMIRLDEIDDGKMKDSYKTSVTISDDKKKLDAIKNKIASSE